MRIDTTSGLHGAVVEYISTAIDYSRPGFDGYVLVQRDNPPVRSAPFSTHAVYTTPDGEQVAESGHYDMTLAEARQDLQRRAGRL